MSDEIIIGLKGFAERRYEPTVWGGGEGSGDEIEYLESTGYSSPRQSVSKRKKLTKRN